MQAEASGSALEARGLVKRYGKRAALRGIDFQAQPGELLAVIGPNGAGKTTLLSILAGIVRADAGEIRLPGGEVGWVPQQAALYRRLTVEENLRLFARLEGHDDPEATVREMLELTGLEERRGELIAGSPAETSSGSTSPSAFSPGRWCCCSTSPASASTRASGRGSGSSSRPSPAAGRR